MELLVDSEKDMQELGYKLAQRLPDTGAVIELIGDVGSGKTTLVKGLARGLGVSDIVQSPSYTIFCRYDVKSKSLHHYDFYRLQDPGLVSYDLDESLNTPGAITVIEWADNVQGVLPKGRITIHINTVEENKRSVSITGLEI